MNNIVNNLMSLGNKYNFEINKKNNIVNIIVKNTDNKDVEWISYNTEKDSVSHRGNTDQCNLWFYQTRKDLTPYKLIQFTEDLNAALELVEGETFSLSELIDPEDWQEIANVNNAYDDERYIMQ